jgi:glycerol-1-phosphatase
VTAPTAGLLTPGSAWIVDLDGVVWLAGDPIDGVTGAIERLRTAGVRVLFVTNNSAPTLEELRGRMAHAGIAVDVGDFVTSAQAAATLVGVGERVLALADGGAREALEARGARVVEEGPADVVLVGWTHQFDFERLATASTAVRAGARLVGTNEDPTHPTPEGLLPGSGALLAAVATAAGARPEVAGKPCPPMVTLILSKGVDARIVVGDRPSTDGALATALGLPFALVYSGVTSREETDLRPRPDLTAADLRALVDQVLAGTV